MDDRTTRVGSEISTFTHNGFVDAHGLSESVNIVDDGSDAVARPSPKTRSISRPNIAAKAE